MNLITNIVTQNTQNTGLQTTQLEQKTTDQIVDTPPAIVGVFDTDQPQQVFNGTEMITVPLQVFMDTLQNAQSELDAANQAVLDAQAVASKKQMIFDAVNKAIN